MHISGLNKEDSAFNKSIEASEHINVQDHTNH